MADYSDFVLCPTRVVSLGQNDKLSVLTNLQVSVLSLATMEAER